MPLTADDDQYSLVDALLELGKVKYALDATGASDEAITYTEQFADAIEDLVLNPVNPLPVKHAIEVALAIRPAASFQVAVEVAAAIQLTHAIDLDYERTGRVSIDVSAQARLEVAERLAKREIGDT
jgi:hypothetical protein